MGIIEDGKNGTRKIERINEILLPVKPEKTCFKEKLFEPQIFFVDDQVS